MGSSSEIAILIPFFGSSVKEAFITKIYEQVLPTLKDLGYIKVVIQPIDENFAYIEKNKTVTFTGRVPKGMAIREGINKETSEDDPGFILCIDGSGRIPHSAIEDAVKTFQDTKCDAVFAHRQYNKGIDPERYSIERFEIFLVEEKYNAKIPDGQCGLWGFVPHKDAERKINLTADGYEIELDILTEILKNKLTFSFFPVKIESTTTSQSLFSAEEHLPKLKFLAEKLGYKKWHLIKFAEHYNETNGEHRLPEEYMKMLNEMEIEEPKVL